LRLQIPQQRMNALAAPKEQQVLVDLTINSIFDIIIKQIWI